MLRPLSSFVSKDRIVHAKAVVVYQSGPGYATAVTNCGAISIGRR